jgi:hypothetical protein
MAGSESAAPDWSGYKISAHTHPNDEHVTVISGAFHFGIGARLDDARGTMLEAGGFAHAAKGMPHYAWTSEETIVQVHGQAAQGIAYVNPADDPRKKQASALHRRRRSPTGRSDPSLTFDSPAGSRPAWFREVTHNLVTGSHCVIDPPDRFVEFVEFAPIPRQVFGTPDWLVDSDRK